MAVTAKKANMEDQEIAEIIDVEIDPIFSTPKSRNGTTKQNAISVEQYTEDIDLQRALMASLFETSPSKTFVDLSIDQQAIIDDDDDEVRVLNFRVKRQKPLSTPSVTEKGQCSSSRIEANFVCEICAEPRSRVEAFRLQGCGHYYCNDCISNYVEAKLQENITSIGCPISECTGFLEPEYCRDILPLEVFERWGNALCEAIILGTERFYCPYKDCSALLIDEGGEVIAESECPNCWRMFCAKCKVPWHSGIECGEFQKLNKDEREWEDIMVMKLAKKKNWARCPKCSFYVEKVSGCMFVKCRCGEDFCYLCGSKVEVSHYCANCKR